MTTGLIGERSSYIPFIRNSIAVILKVAYGYQVAGNDDQMVHIIEEGFQLSAQMAVAGNFWVESFPFRSSSFLLKLFDMF